MTSDRPTGVRSVARRLLRAGSILFYTGLVASVLWLAATRWNGVPANPGGAPGAASFYSPPIDPALDRTETIIAATALLPALPKVTLPPPPPGMRWTSSIISVVEVLEALSGEWSPQTRPNLQGVIDYLQTPGVKAALSQLAEMPLGGWRPFGPKGSGMVGLRAARAVAKLLVVRARYRQAGCDDIGGALADLAVAYRLSATMISGGTNISFFTGTSCSLLADGELRQLARERALTREQAARAIRVIQATCPTLEDVGRTLSSDSVAEARALIDAGWTDDGSGVGWLVLSRWDPPYYTSPAAAPRYGVWNLFSPLFNDRRTVLAKTTRLSALIEAAFERPYATGIVLLDVPFSKRPFTLTDGPLARAGLSMTPRTFNFANRYAASRRATIIALALSAYRHDHGEYPASLDQLLEKHLETMPLDPFVGQPFGYRIDADSFLLYSVGHDQIDEGGQKTTLDLSIHWSERGGDLPYVRPRPEPRFEPTLERIEP